MLRPSKLQVKPVRRYKTPQYPSHLDPDPTLFPQPVPYPAGRKLLAAIAAVGLATTTSCSGPKVGSTGPTSDTTSDVHTVQVEAEDDGSEDAAEHEAVKPADRPEFSSISAKAFIARLRAARSNAEIPTTAGVNPFPVALSGLPHRTSPYGTGMPNYCDAELARRVIERTFKDAGYRLKLKQPYKHDGVALVIDGYDADKHVGFVVAGYDNLDTDAYVRWTSMRKGSQASINQEIETLLQAAKRDDSLKAFMADIESAQRLPDPARRETAFRAILAKRHDALLSLEEIKRLEDRRPQDKDFIAVISAFDERFADWALASFSDEEVLKLLETQDPGKQEESLEEKLEGRRRQEAREAIHCLEQAVREYIAWARSQGAQ